jgi:hypothetical protein
MWTLQVTEYYRRQHDANTALRIIADHTGYLGGTMGERANGEGFYIQAFFRAGQLPRLDPDNRERTDYLGFTEAQ